MQASDGKKYDKMLQAATKLYIKDSEVEGRGVFASADIAEGEILEECHFIFLTDADYGYLDDLKNYVYTFPIYSKTNCIVLGFGSTYNHSTEPNADWETDEENNLFRFTATKAIAEGSEILIDYKTSVNFT